MPESITIKEGEEETNQKKMSASKKQWYKSPWFWVILVAIIAISAALVWYFGFHRPSQTQQEQVTEQEETLQENWETIARESENLVTLTSRAENVDDFENLSKDLGRFLEVLKQAQEDFDDQDSLENDEYQEALESLTRYINTLQTLLDEDVDALETSDFEEVREDAENAQSDVDNFLDETSFVDDELTDEFFNLHISIKSLFDAYQQVQDEEQKQKEEEEAEQEQEAQDQNDVQSAANSFAQAFIDGDEGDMRNVMTGNFESEFDFSRLEDEYREFYAPVSFRTIELVRDSEERYYVYGRMTEDQVGGDDKYTYDFNLTIVKNGSDWLVDLDSAPSR